MCVCRRDINIVQTSCLDARSTPMTRHRTGVRFVCRRDFNVVATSRFDVYTTSMIRRYKDVGFGTTSFQHRDDVSF